MNVDSLPSPKLLRQLLKYEPETGKLFWRTRFNGREAFTYTDKGYRRGAVFGRMLRAHRVAWAIYYGEWPKDEIDHINGDKSDNRICNLRDVNRAENTHNLPLSPRNKTGHVGLFFDKKRQKWQSRIMVGGSHKHLGYFSTKPEAIAARQAAQKILGYHPNHGRPPA